VNHGLFVGLAVPIELLPMTFLASLPRSCQFRLLRVGADSAVSRKAKFGTIEARAVSVLAADRPLLLR
jgi:hypothetical protein